MMLNANRTLRRTGEYLKLRYSKDLGKFVETYALDQGA